ncbi:hypothetical protein V6N12_050875 [Hibiscus sabdariffa]|uniref:Reverse transcriptase zinc-binding domain-containing protein n=1 Tax=Hibiscus sabdariffa TaxID=183260 RepID=A0ABR2GDZ9_9ROSI
MFVIWRNVVEVQDDARVQQCMGRSSFTWVLGIGAKILFWRDNWCTEELQAIINGCMMDGSVNNRLIWKPTHDGKFTVGALYKLMVSFGLEDDVDCSAIWQLEVPPEFSTSSGP